VKVEAKPKRIFIARLNLNGLVALTRQFFGIGKNPKFTCVSSFERVEIALFSTEASVSSPSQVLESREDPVSAIFSSISIVNETTL
jgi:hypothetical protein